MINYDDIHTCPECKERTMDSAMVCLQCGFPHADRVKIGVQLMREFYGEIDPNYKDPFACRFSVMFIKWLEEQS